MPCAVSIESCARLELDETAPLQHSVPPPSIHVDGFQRHSSDALDSPSSPVPLASMTGGAATSMARGTVTMSASCTTVLCASCAMYTAATAEKVSQRAHSLRDSTEDPQMFRCILQALKGLSVDAAACNGMSLLYFYGYPTDNASIAIHALDHCLCS